MNLFFILAQDQQKSSFLQNDLTLPDKKVLKMLFGMSTIILKWSHSPGLIVFRYSCFKIGQSEPRVAYKSVANKKKACNQLLVLGKTLALQDVP